MTSPSSTTWDSRRSPADLVRVEDRLDDAVSRRRPLPRRRRRPPARRGRQAAPARPSPSARGYAAARRGRARDRRRRRHRRRRGRARAPRVALPRRRDRRGRDPARRAVSVNARWSNIVAILAGDYLLAQASALAASLGADVAALLAATIGELCRGQVLELQHLFDADAHRGVVPLVDRGQDRVADGDRVRGSAAMVSNVSADTPRRAHAVRPSPRHVLPGRRRRARRHRAPRPSSASRPATTCTKASTRCP